MYVVDVFLRHCLLAAAAFVSTALPARPGPARIVSTMSETIYPIMSWNPRGLNTPARRTAVVELASAAKTSIICLQETKLAHIDRSLAIEIDGASRQDFVFLPAEETRGGIDIFWDATMVSLTNTRNRNHSITATITMISLGSTFLLTVVYGPSIDAEKPAFLQELSMI
jgi:exonuclease III